MSDLLQYENYQVVSLVQAMLGSITTNMRVISLKCYKEKHILLHFILEYDTAEDREEIEDIAAELEALQDSFIQLDLSVQVDSRKLSALEIPGRRVYVRRSDITRIEANL